MKAAQHHLLCLGVLADLYRKHKNTDEETWLSDDDLPRQRGTTAPRIAHLNRTTAMSQSTEAALERALQPQTGDKYTRTDGRMTVEVRDVLGSVVIVECVEDGNCENHSWPLETFQRLAQKTIEYGAKFEPAATSHEPF